MSTPASRRLVKDLNVINTESKESNIIAMPLESDIFCWVAVICGPKNTPYENGTFSLMLQFTEKYPQDPPEVSFISKMFHPNIYENGDICLDILKNKWSPSYDVLGILLSISSLLNDPNTDSPANMEASKMIEEDKAEYDRRVKLTVELSWDDIDKEIAKKGIL